ncbi:hypothetical protein Cgig2_013526 [Carnegiea gigantea]|uniref:RRM domain-containing protein n=1 Tax=Carnegiea gigantea TaxID=171969 RepID=A0A9Q1JMN6_9CARY|nr:hypothetical protein Cgig2_013526 [Carnegiea gigantea]
MNRYGDYTDGREMGPKRQRLMDQGSSYYGSSPGYGASPGFGAGPGSSFMYNPPPYAGYTGQPPPFPVVRLRGLPFDCTEADIAEFLRGLDIVDVLFVHKGGRFTGEAYCVLGYPMQVDFALQRNRQNIGRRYVEVFRSKRHEYYKAIAGEVADAQSGSPHRGARAKSHDERKDLLEHTGILRLRGLPYSARREDIKNFFKDFVLEDDVIHITYNSAGKPSGEAFVEFSSPDDSKAAMVKDNMTLGSRYIELFPATREEMDEAIVKGRPPNPDEDPNEPVKHTGILRLRGLPFSATEEDIVEFFNGFVLSKDSVHITFNADGRATGEAFVEFASAEDSEAAMEKDRKTLGSRYIELFPSSQEELNEALSKGR